jgi:hypothetical protein
MRGIRSGKLRLKIRTLIANQDINLKIEMGMGMEMEMESDSARTCRIAV